MFSLSDHLIEFEKWFSVEFASSTLSKLNFPNFFFRFTDSLNCSFRDNLLTKWTFDIVSLMKLIQSKAEIHDPVNFEKSGTKNFWTVIPLKIQIRIDGIIIFNLSFILYFTSYSFQKTRTGDALSSQQVRAMRPVHSKRTNPLYRYKTHISYSSRLAFIH